MPEDILDRVPDLVGLGAVQFDEREFPAGGSQTGSVHAAAVTVRRVQGLVEPSLTPIEGQLYNPVHT